VKRLQNLEHIRTRLAAISRSGEIVFPQQLFDDARELLAHVDELRGSLLTIGERAIAGVAAREDLSGPSPATAACTAIVAELTDLGMPLRRCNRGTRGCIYGTATHVVCMTVTG
jgi:hypothetical protein